MSDFVREKPSSKSRHVTIGICTSASRYNIKAFIAKVASLTNVTVRFIELPYNDLDNFRLSSEGLDRMIICHSINNRRFAITDVMDALYDVFLPHVKQVFGKDSVCVIAHDFPWPMGSAKASREDHLRTKGTYMDSFRSKQPTTFECSNLAMICGRLDNQVDMDEEDWQRLEVFLLQCRAQPESDSGSPHDSKSTMGLLFAIAAGISSYVMLRILRAVRDAFASRGDNAPVHADSSTHASRGMLGSVVSFIRLPFEVSKNMMAIVLPWTSPNDASRTVWTSFKEDVIWKTLECPNSSNGLFGLVYWICSIPSRFVFHSSWFAVSLVWKFFCSAGKYFGVAAATFILVPFLGKAYYSQRPDDQESETASDGSILHWSKAPWWSVPYRFWLHIFRKAA